MNDDGNGFKKLKQDPMKIIKRNLYQLFIKNDKDMNYNDYDDIDYFQSKDFDYELMKEEI